MKRVWRYLSGKVKKVLIVNSKVAINEVSLLSYPALLVLLPYQILL